MWWCNLATRVDQLFIWIEMFMKHKRKKAISLVTLSYKKYMCTLFSILWQWSSVNVTLEHYIPSHLHSPLHPTAWNKQHGSSCCSRWKSNKVCGRTNLEHKHHYHDDTKKKQQKLTMCRSSLPSCSDFFCTSTGVWLIFKKKKKKSATTREHSSVQRLRDVTHHTCFQPICVCDKH